MNAKRDRNKCLNCGTEVKRYVDKYCNNICQAEYQYKQYIIRWLGGLENGMSGSTSISGHIRRYLHELHSGSCQLCGWAKIHPITGLVPLAIHHIDGNHTNNTFDNLQLLCPNCHSLTETHGSLNIGKGRKYTRVYK